MPTAPVPQNMGMIDRARRFTSLDAPQDMSLGETLADIGMGFAPGIGTAQGFRDFERARRDDDLLGMALGGISVLPLAGGLVKAGRAAGDIVEGFGDAAARAARGATSPLEGAMDMSTDARMQRADEGRFLPETVYHGTRQDIPEFDVSQQVKYRKTDAPPGAFTFSSSPRVAGSYTGQSRSRAGAANIIPAKLRMQNPFVIDAANHGWSQLPVPHSALNDVDPINYPKSQNFDRDGNERMLYMSTNDLAKKVAASGKYDGVIMRNLWDSGNLKTKEVSDIYTVFDPSNIRSVNAAFDPAMRGSANLLAGAAGATIGLSALRNIQREDEQSRID
jgi:hypothetical protein